MRKAMAGVAGLALAAAMPAMAQAPTTELRIAAIDTEGGSAILFVTPEGRSLLVDTGFPAGAGLAPNAPADTSTSAQRIKAAAARFGVTRIDYLLVTHYHRDHVGGVGDLLAVMPVGTFIDHGPNREVPPAGTPAAQSAPAMYARYVGQTAGHRRLTPRAGDHLTIGLLRLDFVTGDGKVAGVPDRPVAGCDAMPDMARDGGVENAMSLGFVATFGAARIATLGDTTWNVEKRLTCPAARIAPVDIWFVSHHGSGLSNSPQLIEALAPRVAIVNNGPRKGADPEVLARLLRVPGRAPLWQVHRPLRTPELAADEARIANLTDLPDAAYPILAYVGTDRSIRVENPRNGYVVRYPALR